MNESAELVFIVIPVMGAAVYFALFLFAKILEI